VVNNIISLMKNGESSYPVSLATIAIGVIDQSIAPNIAI